MLVYKFRSSDFVTKVSKVKGKKGTLKMSAKFWNIISKYFVSIIIYIHCYMTMEISCHLITYKTSLIHLTNNMCLTRSWFNYSYDLIFNYSIHTTYVLVLMSSEIFNAQPRYLFYEAHHHTSHSRAWSKGK